MTSALVAAKLARSIAFFVTPNREIGVVSSALSVLTRMAEQWGGELIAQGLHKRLHFALQESPGDVFAFLSELCSTSPARLRRSPRRPP